MYKTRKSYPKRDLKGQKFGMLTPVEWLHGGYWICQCDCGNETVVNTRMLMNGHTRSCGCLRYASKNVTDMTGYEDESLKVISRQGALGEAASWLCLCKHCGRQFIARGSNIRNGETTSCGCVHSSFERKIISILLENGIQFDSQVTFPGLKGVGGRDLRFDFAIYEDNMLMELIEYNGPQHYKRIPGIWGDYYDITVEHDRRKKEFCERHRVKFKVISYNDPCETLSDILD